MERWSTTAANLPSGYTVGQWHLSGWNPSCVDVHGVQRAEIEGTDLTGRDRSGTKWERTAPPGAMVVLFQQVPPEPEMQQERAEQLPTIWTETPTWPQNEEHREEEEAWPPDEEQMAEQKLAEEEWTSGMVRPRPKIERPELEEESIGIAEQPPLKEPQEAEEESKYGI